MKTEKFEMIAKTFQGLEDVLAQEIIAIGGEEVEIGKRMVSFVGDKEMMYKANLYLRTALRILKPINTFSASNTDEVYEAIKLIKWEDYLREDQTFSIDSVVFSDNFRHSKFVTYRVKDAIADYFNEKTGNRPSVRLTNADLALNLHIAGHTCTLSLDSSGESLHKRGYRVDQNEAPLNEVLAAGMILKTGWNGQKNFIDPMCGSGTLLIEAAMIATNTPPGIYRQGFAFEKWKDYDSEMFDRLYNDDDNEKEFEFKIYGSDISPRAIAIAQDNIKSAGFSRYITLKTLPFQQYTEAPANAVLIMNPPYGERISSKDILSLYELIGRQLKHVFKGYEAWVLSYREECFEKIGLKPSEKIELMNGGLDCEFRKYEIFEGKLKDFKSEGNEFHRESAVDSIDEVDTDMKRELRKERFLKMKGDSGRGRSDKGRGFTKERRESTFKKFGESREQSSEESGERTFGERRERSFDRKPREFGERSERSFGDRKPREFGERRERSFGDRKPREFGERSERSFGDRKPREFGERSERSFGDRKPREFGERRERSFGDRKPREFGERSERSFGDRKPREFGERSERSFGDRKPREFGDRKPREFGERSERTFGDRKPREFKPRDADHSAPRAGRYEQSGNFRRNAEGKLELRTDGEFKPRGERKFNPNRQFNLGSRTEEDNNESK